MRSNERRVNTGRPAWFWRRVVRDSGNLLARLRRRTAPEERCPGASDHQAALLRAEGHRVVAGRETPKV